MSNSKITLEEALELVEFRKYTNGKWYVGVIKGNCDTVKGDCHIVEGDCDTVRGNCQIVEGDCVAVKGKCHIC